MGIAGYKPALSEKCTKPEKAFILGFQLVTIGSILYAVFNPSPLIILSTFLLWISELVTVRYIELRHDFDDLLMHRKSISELKSSDKRTKTNNEV